MGLVPHHSSTYGDRAIAVPQILRDFANLAGAKIAHQIARLVRFGIPNNHRATDGHLERTIDGNPRRNRLKGWLRGSQSSVLEFSRAAA